MHPAIFLDAALMLVKCSMTYINKERDIQISLARLIFFFVIVALLASFLLFVVGLFACAQGSPEVAAEGAASSSTPLMTKSSIADPAL
jgi:hypothetical protein